MAVVQKSRHAAVSSWFLGPRAENFEYLEKLFDKVLMAQKHARVTLYAQDGEFITDDIQTDEMFEESLKTLEIELETISTMLSKHSVPFWSPRYNGHMNMDISMPAIIGYMTAMLYNPNNCSTEASPFTTYIEKEVGLQLCRMLGYNTKRDVDKPIAWGHITCGGTVANFEAIWAARNTKYYALSLKLAIERGMLRFLQDVQPPFEVELCTGKRKAFLRCTTWELLNLKASTIFDLPTKLFNLYGISQAFMNKAMEPFLCQTVGKDYIEDYFRIDKPAQMFVGTTKHYSWPKGGALVGIGSENVIDVPVDEFARMDIAKLDEMLNDCIDSEYESERRAIYAVVAIIGSTESGAVDPLKDIVDLRKKYEARGLTFLIHCDAAWGGYFASMIREPETAVDVDPDADTYFVPSMTLLPYTKIQLEHFQEADSITIDPHKSGYIPYPNGALCYQDERMRSQVTFTSPIVFRAGDELESIGVYGIEGSKPGAAPVAAYLSHQVIGTHKLGYGALLGEATFSCTKLYCHWATMTTDDMDLIVVPLNRLPTEEVENPDPKAVEAQKKFIRERICNKNNHEIAQDKEAYELMAELGGDSMINAFACNFRINGKVNEDVIEANYLNRRLFERLSVRKISDDPETRPIILTHTTFSQKAYGGCLDTFKKRLGLKGDQDLGVLVNVTMSPWPTMNNFIKELADSFRKVAEEELHHCLVRNQKVPDHHGFIMQGTDKIYFVHLPMFHMENHRYQLIFTGDIPQSAIDKYKAAKAANPDQYYTLGHKDKMILDDMLKPGASWDAVIDVGIPQEGVPHVAEGFKISNIQILVKESLHSDKLDTTYPEQMPFYLYGTRDQQHIDHMLRCSPNIQLCSDRVKLSLRRRLTDRDLAVGVCAIFTNVRENALQPLGDTESKEHKKLVWNGFSFHAGDHFAVDIYRTFEDYKNGRAAPITSGTLALGTSVFVDSREINMDPAMHHVPAETPTPAAGSTEGDVPAAEGSHQTMPGQDLSYIIPGERASFDHGAANRRQLFKEWDGLFNEVKAGISLKFEAGRSAPPGSSKKPGFGIGLQFGIGSNAE